ncbi:hypothetical protein DICVIV_12078 [Dictyocaulus viviparus]|uniref:Uncharacterized protein n=1 Tax=Dictyocaulus viviparus TaxID=29172 RepID=A0A0D8XBI9_DICVI|nr:hypothetical protein DICVIV_12078 [Dictyocaulus viviparus]
MLVKLVQNYPLLLESTATRKVEKNFERAKIWEQITHQLDILSVEKVEKLFSCYGRNNNIYDNFKYVTCRNRRVMRNCHSSYSSQENMLYERKAEQGCTTYPSRCDSISSGNGGLERSNATYAAVLSKNGTEQQQMSCITSRSIASLPYCMSMIKSHELESPATPVAGDANYQLKKERNDFVVSMAEHYMERMCFDSSSRSARVNAERHNMWLKIAQLTNEKYMGLLNPLGLEQTKKLFSNCRRRRRIRSQKGDNNYPVPQLLSTSLSLSSSRKHVKERNKSNPFQMGSCLTSDNVSSCGEFSGSVENWEINIKINELRRQLAERSFELEQLQRKVVEQADAYRNHINSIVEILKTAVDKVSEEIKATFSFT